MTIKLYRYFITEYASVNYMTGSSGLFQCKPKLFIGYIIKVLQKLFQLVPTLFRYDNDHPYAIVPVHFINSG